MRGEGWFCQDQERENRRREKAENKMGHLARLEILLVNGVQINLTDQTIYIKA